MNFFIKNNFRNNFLLNHKRKKQFLLFFILKPKEFLPLIHNYKYSDENKKVF